MSKFIQLKENSKKRIAKRRSPLFFKLGVAVGLSVAAAFIAPSSFASTFYTYSITYKDGTKKEVLSTTPPEEYLKVYGDKVKKTEVSIEGQDITVSVEMDLTKTEAGDREFDAAIEKMGGRSESKVEKKPEPPKSPIRAIEETVQTVKDLVKVAAPVVEALAKKAEKAKPQIKTVVQPKPIVKAHAEKKTKPPEVVAKVVVPEKSVVIKKEEKKQTQIAKVKSAKPIIPPQLRDETYMATVTLEEYQRVEKYNNLITKYAKKRGLAPHLVKAVILQESRGDHRGKSDKGALGLMQLRLATARLLDPDVAVEDLYNPEKNISLGTKHLKNMIDYYKGDVVRAVAAYNAGNKPVNYYEGVPPYSETRIFVRRVLSFYQSLEAGIVPV